MMLRIDGIKVGDVYGNGKGDYRKVLKFTRFFDNERIVSTTASRSDIHYVPCDVKGQEIGKERSCWCNTFSQWAKRGVIA